MFTDIQPRTFALLLHLSAAALSLAIVAAGWFVISGPIHQQRAALTQGIADSLAVTRSAASLRQRHAEYQNQVDRLDARLVAMRLKVDNIEPSELFESFARLSRQVGAALQDYRPGQGQVIGSLHEHSVQLSVNGDYASLCQFIAGLEELPMLAHVAHLKLTSSGQANSRLNLELSMRCYGASTLGKPYRD